MGNARTSGGGSLTAPPMAAAPAAPSSLTAPMSGSGIARRDAGPAACAARASTTHAEARRPSSPVHVGGHTFGLTIVRALTEWIYCERRDGFWSRGDSITHVPDDAGWAQRRSPASLCQAASRSAAGESKSGARVQERRVRGPLHGRLPLSVIAHTAMGSLNCARRRPRCRPRAP